ncbi:MAG TPA: 16S rRNA (guanine(527)-N(7))-methyltransferase RsmG [Solirubrobacteraceae bacterium]|nr:16S rRNA (guanine(527)-N(7))-methyltransferase RsmG [Solirubrobacteraceae bacterium]
MRGEAALDIHAADSLSALALDSVRSAHAIADIGSGAGFPGVVLAIALPSASVALIESASRKCEFLERLIKAAGVENARVVNARVEELGDGLDGQDVVTARAVAPLAVLCEYAAPLLRLDGRLVAWKGELAADEEAAASRAAQLLGLRGEEAVRSAPYAGSVAHRLYVFRKVAPTPPRFPRRAGMARKRPLGDAS